MSISSPQKTLIGRMEIGMIKCLVDGSGQQQWREEKRNLIFDILMNNANPKKALSSAFRETPLNVSLALICLV